MTDINAATTQGDNVSTALEPSAHPWRDNIEAVAISIVTIVLFKYFVLEAYKIPTGSMQPTLMGNAETGIYDRVIVDKFSYHYRDPKRFEIAVFKYPLDSSKNYIKRIIGMPGERLFLQGGDAWVQAPGGEPKVLRRPRSIQNAQLRRIQTDGEWNTKRQPGGWKLDSLEKGDTIHTRGTGRMSYPREFQSISDGYLDGYPLSLVDKISQKKKRSNWNHVTDLRVRTDIEVGAGVEHVTLVLHEGDRRFRFTLAGPAAGKAETDSAPPRAAISATGLGIDGESSSQASAVKLDGDDTITVEVQNLNDLLEFRVDGDLIASLEIPAVTSTNPARHVMSSRITVEVEAQEDASADLSEFRIWRDIFYTGASRNAPVTDWQIPEDSYVVLGDNSQDSSDGRDWKFARFQRKDESGEILRGNSRKMTTRDPRTHQEVQDPGSNPLYVPQQAGARQIFLRDERGETHILDPQQADALPDEYAPMVPRSLIRGRAVLVVWPLAPQHDVYRLKWVR